MATSVPVPVGFLDGSLNASSAFADEEYLKAANAESNLLESNLDDDSDLNQILIRAAGIGDLGKVRALLASKADVTAVDKNGE